MYLTWINGLGVSDRIAIMKRQEVVSGKGFHSLFGANHKLLYMRHLQKIGADNQAVTNKQKFNNF